MGRNSRMWQDMARVLGLFSDTESLARRYYRNFMEKGIDQGHREDLIGGGLIRIERKYALIDSGVTSDQIAELAARLTNIETQLIYKPGKKRARVRARSLFCYWSAKELGVHMTDLSRLLKISPSAVSFSVRRGEEICISNDYCLTDLLDEAATRRKKISK